MKRSPLLVIYLTVFIDLLGFGLILPLMPYYAEHLGASGVGVGALLSAFSLAQFLGSPILGKLSDRYGRRRVLLVSLAGSVVAFTLTGFAATLPALIAARALAGLFSATIATAQAYIADVTKPEERTKYMGILGACIGFGFIFGPALGAGLSRFGFGAASFAAAGLSAINLVWAFFVLKEPAQHKNIGADKSPLNLIAQLRSTWNRPVLKRIMVSGFLIMLAFVGMEATFALLAKRHFGLAEGSLGLLFTYFGVIIAVVQGGLVGRISRRWGEKNTALAGMFAIAAGLAILPHTPGLLFMLAAAGVLAAGQGLFMPAISSLVSKTAGAGEQGAVLGLNQALASLARAAGPLAAGYLFDLNHFLPYWSGAAFAFMAFLILRGATSEPPVSTAEPTPSPL